MIAKAIHFTKHKPYVRNPAVPQHWYLTCTPLPSNTGDVVDEDEEEVGAKAYRGRRYGGNFGGLLGRADGVGKVNGVEVGKAGAPLQHARPPANGSVSAPGPGRAMPMGAMGTVRLQVTIPGRAPANVSDEVLQRQRV